ncbi:adenosylcobalamin-dependent ribonucleoside-diphosphate reductase [Candidatus Woesearchaeota archaeon]|nr:adenosylcobalamin-dependent ribonucleoside-diphosphate reductase [Candidatus Woesearchaeota archaeon]
MVKKKKGGILQVIKRDGSIVRFEQEKIVNAVYKAFLAIGDANKRLARKIAEEVVLEVRQKFAGKKPYVEDIQDVVEKALIKNGLNRSAKAYILYREKRRELREYREAILGMKIKTNLSLNALQLLKERYLLKDEHGKIIETPDQMFQRVAKHIASADRLFRSKNLEKTEEEFLMIMKNLDFLPNSPCLMNAGTNSKQLAASVVLPVGDSIEEIFTALSHAALIHHTSAGTGFSFSKVRPKQDFIESTGGLASGPVSFMEIFDKATEIMKRGGRKRGANIAILSVEHPDITEFITVKDEPGQLMNFNISVGMGKEFMQAVLKREEFLLRSPRNQKEVKRIPARDLFSLIAVQAWKNGDPGVLFLDKINKHNPVPTLGHIEATSPCAEMHLLPYEAGHLGSINLANMMKHGKLDTAKLKKTTHVAVHFLDNMLELSKYPVKEMEETTKRTRKIGLGIMGFADLLYQLGIPYNSTAAVKMAGQIITLMQQEAIKASKKLARQRGVFPAYAGSTWQKKGWRVRNATLTAIAPTGSISLIADVSNGIEPNIALCYTRKILDKEFFYVNRYFEEKLKERKLYAEALVHQLTNKASIHEQEGLPKDIKRIFVLAHDISPEWHIKVQAAFQRQVDNGISKTINFPRHATVREVEEAYLLAYKLGCKGVAMYRDQSKEEQIFQLV